MELCHSHWLADRAGLIRSFHGVYRSPASSDLSYHEARTVYETPAVEIMNASHFHNLELVRPVLAESIEIRMVYPIFNGLLCHGDRISDARGSTYLNSSAATD